MDWLTYREDERVRLRVLEDDWDTYLHLDPDERPIDISDAWFDLCIQALHSHVCKQATLTHLTSAPAAEEEGAVFAACRARRPSETFGFDQWDLSCLYELSARFVNTKLVKESQAVYIIANAKHDQHAFHLARKQAGLFLSTLMWSTDAGKETTNLRERFIKMDVYYARFKEEPAFISFDGKPPDPADDYGAADRRANMYALMAGWPPRRAEEGKTYGARTLDLGAERLVQRIRRFLEYDILDMLTRVLWDLGFPSLEEDVDPSPTSTNPSRERATSQPAPFSPALGWTPIGAQDRALATTLARSIYSTWDEQERMTWARRDEDNDEDPIVIAGKRIGRAALNARIVKMARIVAEKTTGADIQTTDVREFTRQVWLELDMLAGQDD